MDLEKATVPPPRGRALLKGWQRDTPAIPLTIPAIGAMQEYQNIKGSDHTFYELMLPEPVMVAAFRQGGAILGAELLVAMQAASALGFMDDAGTAYVSPFDSLRDAVDPSRAMLLSDALAAYDEGRVYNRPLAPEVAYVLETLTGATFPRTAEAVTDPDLPGRVYKGQTAMLPAGYGLIFDNTPLGEVNRILLDYHTSPYEKAALETSPGAAATVRIAQALRLGLGLRTAETSEDIIAKAEVPRREVQTTAPDVKK